MSVYLVGGFFRDQLLGRECHDFDFAVSKGAVSFARTFSKKIKGAFVLLDEKHACARVVKKQKGKIVTFDFADFRGTTVQKDLLGRDFTINTFCCQINSLRPNVELTESFLDMRKGLADLKAKRIKMVSSKAFVEDPLRLVRAFAFAATLGFRIEPKTLARIKKDRDLIRDVSFERIRDELFKILGSSKAASTLKAMDKIGLLEKIVPQVTFMVNVKQGGYHHLDIWKHSLETVKQVEKLIKEVSDEEICAYLSETLAGGRTRAALLKMAALLHDIGKPDTLKKEGVKMSFHSHERVGKSIVRSIAKNIRLSTKERFVLQDMVLWHLRPGYLSNFKKPSERRGLSVFERYTAGGGFNRTSFLG